MKKKIKSICIEPTKLCNTHCIVCPRETLLSSLISTTMSLEDFKTAVTRTLDYFDPDELAIIGFGDLSADKHSVSRLRWLKNDLKWNKAVALSTNGAVLKKQVLDEILSENLATELTFSVFANDRETYKLTNQRDQFDKVVENLEYAISMKHKTGSKVILRLYTLLMDENKHQFKELVRRWSKKVDFLSAWMPHNWSNKRDYRVNNFDKSSFPCKRVTDLDLVIRSNGDVTACCLDINHQLVYGNILQTTFEQMFTQEGSFFKKLLEEHLSAKVPEDSICNNCDFLNAGNTEALIYQERVGLVEVDQLSKKL